MSARKRAVTMEGMKVKQPVPALPVPALQRS
jgi:hypothetical protein